MWEELLTSVATGARRLVLETADGHRAVLLAESELLRLEELAAATAGGAAPDDEPSLTAREGEVLGLAASGLSGAQIAGRLGLAPNTVAQHLAAARRAFGVSSTAAAVAAAQTAGTLPPGAHGEAAGMISP